MIIWGGWNERFEFRWEVRILTTNSWTATGLTGAPAARMFHTAVWNETEMIVWGGNDFNPNDTYTGGRYDPSTNKWIPTSVINAATPRANHTAVWTGNEMIVFGGDKVSRSIAEGHMILSRTLGLLRTQPIRPWAVGTHSRVDRHRNGRLGR